MPRRAPFALLLCLGVLAILAPNATAITLTNHVLIPHGVTRADDLHRVVAWHVGLDSDHDGIWNGPDECAHQAGPRSNRGCKPPPPPPEPAPVAQPVSEPLAPTPAPAVSVATTTDAIPSYIVACESGGSYTAVNPSSGAYGKYQIMPSTAAAYGCDLSTPSGQDQCAGEIYADVGASAWSCG